jgi:hypothetical protein
LRISDCGLRIEETATAKKSLRDFAICTVSGIEPQKEFKQRRKSEQELRPRGAKRPTAVPGGNMALEGIFRYPVGNQNNY